MSRHRNLKNIVQEDYYDYDDDDYYDDYYDEEDYSKPKAAAPKNNKKKNNQAKATPATTTKAAPTVTAKPAVAAIPRKDIPKQSSSPPAVTVSAGISKAPPGWGTPSTAASAVPKGDNSHAGIAKPPAGWGKPESSTIPATTAMPSSTAKTTTAPTTAQGGKNNSAINLPPVPSILLDQSTQRSQLSMVVIGHVDAGKSTLMGQLLYQLGHVTKRQAQKISNSGTSTNAASTGSDNNNDNIQWAWLLDEDDAEREHGVTMQIATKAITTKQHDIIILDAPGHADFIPMMITGAANADTGLLVVDSGDFDTGFLSGQTKEHIILSRGLGVSQLIVCINKLDLHNWDPTLYHNIKDQLLPFLTKQANFVPKRIRFIPTSGLTGGNVSSKNSDTAKDESLSDLYKWYKGPSLLDAIDTFLPVKQRSIDKPLRYILTDVYADGKHVGARGRIVQGYMKQGEKIVLLPIGDEAVVSSITHLQQLSKDVPSERLNFAVAGDTIDITLSGIDIVRVSVGNIISLLKPIPARPPLSKKFRGQILVMDTINIPIIRGASLLFHIHNLDIPCILSNLISATKRDGSKKKDKPRAITSGSSAIVEITLNEKTCIEAFVDCNALGRFVLRRGGETVAVGKIEEVL